MKLSKLQFARKLEVSEAEVGRWETDQEPGVTDPEVKRLLMLLGVEVPLSAPEPEPSHPGGVQRPQTRAECPPVIEGRRTCPWWGCRYHLGLHMTSRGRLYMNRNADALEYDCALDVVDANPNGMTLDAVGVLLGGLSRERVRQLEEEAFKKLSASYPDPMDFVGH